MHPDPAQGVGGEARRGGVGMEGEGELYEDMVAALVEYLYPEGRSEP